MGSGSIGHRRLTGREKITFAATVYQQCGSNSESDSSWKRVGTSSYTYDPNTPVSLTTCNGKIPNVSLRAVGVVNDSDKARWEAHGNTDQSGTIPVNFTVADPELETRLRRAIEPLYSGGRTTTSSLSDDGEARQRQRSWVGGS